MAKVIRLIERRFSTDGSPSRMAMALIALVSITGYAAIGLLVYATYSVSMMLVPMWAGAVVAVMSGFFIGRTGIDVPRVDFPRIWLLFSFALTKQARERVFEPACNDMLEQYMLSRRYRTRLARAWLTFAFTVRTMLMVLDCLRAMAGDRAVHWLARVVPNPVKRWWLS